MKVIFLFLTMLSIGNLFAAPCSKILLFENNTRSTSLESHEISTFFEPFFKDIVTGWTGGINPIGKYGIKINIFATINPNVKTNAQFARGSLNIIIGGDVKEKDVKRVLQNIVAHELGHVVFEKLAGLGGYSQSSVFDDLAGYENSKDKAYLSLAINELFADVFSLYLTGIPNDNVLLRGPLFDFSRKINVLNKNFDPNNYYHHFLPSRKAIYDQYLKSNGSYDDLGRYYSLFIKFLLQIANSNNLNNINNLSAIAKINDDLSKEITKLSSFPLPYNR